MDKNSLLRECNRLKELLTNLKSQIVSDSYRSIHAIQLETVTRALSQVGRQLLEIDRVHGDRNVNREFPERVRQAPEEPHH